MCEGDKFRRKGNGGALTAEAYVRAFVEGLKSVMYRLEPSRWIIANGGAKMGNTAETGMAETLPSTREFLRVAEYLLCRYLPSILETQRDAYSSVKPRDRDYRAKAYTYAQRQKEILEEWHEFAEG